MRTIVKLALLLVVLPAALLWLAWKLTELPGLQPPAPDASASPGSVESNANGPDAGDGEATAIKRREWRQALEQRMELARWCVGRGLSVTDREMRQARLMLVVATGPECARSCEAERVAEHLNNSYSLEGLRVLLIRTRLDNRMDTPMGVTTVVLPDCAGLVEPHGSDYFLRAATGELYSAGERHEAAGGADEAPAFNPEPSVRRRLNLRH